MKLVMAAIAAILVLGGCRDEKAGLFELSGRVFIFNPRIAVANYVVTLRPVGPAGEAARAIAEFEDPAGGDVIVVEQKIWPKTEKVTLESPPVFCIVKDRAYRIAIRIEDAAGAPLQRIDTEIISTLDQSVMPDKPLVIGPAYDPNPALAERGSGAIGARPRCPPPG